MSRLLHVNFSRMWKSRLFWGEMIGMFALGVLFVISALRMTQWDASGVGLDNVIPGYLTVIGVISALFCGVFCGTDYSDGTIRNKLIAGHTRLSIYLSNFITHAAGALLCCGAYFLAAILLGLPFLGGFRTAAGTLAIMLLGSTVTVLAFSALFTLVSMLSQSRSTGVSICLISFFVLFFAGMIVMQRLQEPEIFDAYSYMDEDGTMVQEDAQPNPKYLTGTKRKFYEFLNDANPMGQMVQYTNIQVENPGLLMLYSFGIIILSTAAGVVIFRKKDVK